MRFSPADTIALQEAVAAGNAQLSREDKGYIQALYNAEVRDADAAFAAMLADLDELGVADRTAVILVADHGEELWERGGFGHGSHLYQEVLNVPLVITAPGMSGPAVVERDVSLVDLYATALDLAGITAGPETQGVSLLAPWDSTLPRPIFAHLPGKARSLKLGRYKLIVPLRGQRELFDLTADPEERQNLMDQTPLVERYMRNVFGIGVAYQSAWSRSRWGAANNMSPAFAADHGL
jgi:arylsulfatase A-like enzyme